MEFADKFKIETIIEGSEYDTWVPSFRVRLRKSVRDMVSIELLNGFDDAFAVIWVLLERGSNTPLIHIHDHVEGADPMIEVEIHKDKTLNLKTNLRV